MLIETQGVDIPSSLDIVVVRPFPGGVNRWLQPLHPSAVDTNYLLWEETAAIVLAISQLNNDSSILPSTTLNLIFLNTLDTSTPPLAQLAQAALVKKPSPSVFYGFTAQEDAHDAAILGGLQTTPVVSTTLDITSPASVSNVFTSFVASNAAEGRALASLARHYFSSVAVITVLGDGNLGTGDIMRETLHAFLLEASTLNLTVSASETVLFHSNNTLERQSILRSLVRVRSSSLVIVLLAGPRGASTVLSEAASASLNMLSKPFVWMGTRCWLDSSSTIAKSLLPFFLGTSFQSSRLSNASQLSAFQSQWRLSHQHHPNSTLRLLQPLLNESSIAYYSTFGLGRALDSYVRAVKICNDTQLSSYVTSVKSAGHVNCSDSTYWHNITLQDCCNVDSNAGGTVLLRHLRQQRETMGYADTIGFAVGGSLLSSSNTASLRCVGSWSAAGVAMNSLQTSFWIEAGYGGVPSAAATVEIQVEGISSNAQVFILCVCLAVALALVALLVLNLAWRNEPAVKMSSPVVNSVVLIGLLLCLVFVCLQSTQDNLLGDFGTFETRCYAQVWTLCVGYTLTIASFFGKLHRLNSVFNAHQLKVRKLGDGHVLGIVGLFLALDLIVLTAWTSQMPIHQDAEYGDIIVDSSNPSRAVQTVAYSCDAGGSKNIMLALFAAYKMLLLAAVAYLAFRVRRVRFEALNDSHSIAFIVYNILLLIIVLVPLTFFFGQSRRERGLLTAMSLVAVVVSTAAILYVPKLWQVLSKNRVEQRYDATTGANETDATYRFDTSTGLGVEDNLIMVRLRKLEQENRELKDKMRALNRTFADNGNNGSVDSDRVRELNGSANLGSATGYRRKKTRSRLRVRTDPKVARSAPTSPQHASSRMPDMPSAEVTMQLIPGYVNADSPPQAVSPVAKPMPAALRFGSFSEAKVDDLQDTSAIAPRAAFMATPEMGESSASAPVQLQPE